MEQSWDAVMTPGAGFPSDFIQRINAFRDERFGIRVQHILNDPTKRDRFLEVNKAFKPHLVIFNNLAWPPGTFTEFQAERFHALPGAVDVGRFRAAGHNDHDGFVIGALMNKNPEPLLAALDGLPDDVKIRFFGRDPGGVRKDHADAFASGRVEWAGVLEDDALPDYYAGLDCVVSTENFAGWSNLCAEAMAAGVPVVCTPHGTEAFAEHERTALVIETPEPASIAAAVERLRTDPELSQRLSAAARERIAAFDWKDYARDLLGLLSPETL